MMSQSVQSLFEYIYLLYLYGTSVKYLELIFDVHRIALKVKVICTMFIWKQYVYIYKLKVHYRKSVWMVACVCQCEDEFLLIAYSGWGPGTWPWPMATLIMQSLVLRIQLLAWTIFGIELLGFKYIYTLKHFWNTSS